VPFSVFNRVKLPILRFYGIFRVRIFCCSQSNKHLFLGMDDGTVRIQPLHGDDAGLMGPYWSLTVHDNDHGAVSRLSMSFDCKYLFSVGNDGNFFAFLVMDDKRLEKKIAEARAAIPSAKVGHLIYRQCAYTSIEN
jgi:hypothetical protein